MKVYSSQNGMFGYYNESYFIECGYDIVVKAVLKNFDTGNVTLIVEFVVAREVVTATLNFNDMKEVLNDKGYAVSNENERHIKSYLHQQIDGKKSIQVYDSLGWCKTKSGAAFKGNMLQNTNGKMAIYRGSYDIKPRGVKEDFVKDLQDVIIGNTALETAVVIGLSACVIGYISSYATIDTMICNIYGFSTTGKTTAAKLAVSMGCNIDCGKSKQSLATNCSATKNALLGTLNNNNGYPILFDELGRLDKKTEMHQLIYEIADGIDKARLSKNGALKTRNQWATTVMFTGEISLLDEKNTPKGTEVRVLSFPYVEWTKDEKQAQAVERFSKQYSGLGIELLADNIVKDNEGLLTAYEKYAEEIKEKFPAEENCKARIAKHVAVIKLTSELISRTLDVKFNTEAIVDFVMCNLNMQTETASWKKAYSYILGQIYRNLGKFGFNKPEPCMHYISGCSGEEFFDKVPHSDAIGYIVYGDDEEGFYLAEKCVLSVATFDSWMNSGNFSGVIDILREWRKKKLLQTKDSTHLATPKSIVPSGALVPCYVINLKNSRIKKKKEIIPPKTAKDIPLPEYEQVTTAQCISTLNEDVEGVENPC